MTPDALVEHLKTNLPGAWRVTELPRLLRRRAYGARLLLGDCHLYVAATRCRVDVLALDVTGIVYFCPDAHPSHLLANVRAAARAIVALHPTTAPTWATETP
jgi:hypothetical protein